MTARTVSKAASRRTGSRPARAAAIAAVAAASLVSSNAKADAAANMNLGYEFLDGSTNGPPDDESESLAPHPKTYEGKAVEGKQLAPAGPTPAASDSSTADITGTSSVGNAALDKGRAGAGQAAVGERLDASPVTPGPGSGSGLAAAEQLYKSGRFDDALPAFRAIVDAEPGHAHAWLRLGNLMHRKRDWFDALSAYRRAARPDADPAIREKAIYNVALLNLELARQALKRLERLRADAGPVVPGSGAFVPGVRAEVIRSLSDQLGSTYGALSVSRGAGPKAGAAAPSDSAAAPSDSADAPAPGPRAPKSLRVERPAQVEIRQGGVAR